MAAGEDASSPLARLSVVIVSRHRPRRLEACLTALSRQDHPDFEIVVVADPASVGLRPELVAEVSYDHASGGRIRHGARLLRFRDDRDPASCTADQLEA